MPIIKSARKRVRVSRKAASRNAHTKRALKTALKSFESKASATTHASAQSALDTAVKKGIVHKNKAARLKKRLATQAKAAGAKPVKKTSTSKSDTNKPAAKKPASVKTTQK